MAADLQLVGDTLSALQPFAQQEKCASCECLQGALVELRMALEELPEDAERERLLFAVTQAMQIQSPHGCLGCEPCAPADTLATYYREQQAQEIPSPCACKDG
ncbi:MAG: hypothetical protein NTW68_13505 [candidate division NC10 bacterium]|nr:hypothetical protein [candidate division NC10 bacterium]